MGRERRGRRIIYGMGLYDAGGIRYVWRFNEGSNQVLLEKHMEDTKSRHYIGALYIKVRVISEISLPCPRTCTYERYAPG